MELLKILLNSLEEDLLHADFGDARVLLRYGGLDKCAAYLRNHPDTKGLSQIFLSRIQEIKEIIADHGENF